MKKLPMMRWKFAAGVFVVVASCASYAAMAQAPAPQAPHASR